MENVMEVKIEIEEGKFKIYDMDYNELAYGAVFTSYECETDSYILDSVEVFENFVFDNEKIVKEIVEDHFDLGCFNIQINLNNNEIQNYNNNFFPEKVEEKMKNQFYDTGSDDVPYGEGYEEDGVWVH